MSVSSRYVDHQQPVIMCPINKCYASKPNIFTQAEFVAHLKAHHSGLVMKRLDDDPWYTELFDYLRLVTLEYLQTFKNIPLSIMAGL